MSIVIVSVSANREGAGENLECWWSLPASNVLQQLGVSPSRGLDADTAMGRLERYGRNVFRQPQRISFLSLLAEGVRQPMIVLLLAIAMVSVIFGRIIEAAVMAMVVVAYVAVEFVNKYRTSRILEQLREITRPFTRVIREGKEMQVPSADVVPGDIIVLSAGSLVPADGRLVRSSGLLMDESRLTGESTPVAKDAEAVLPPETPLHGRSNSAYAGTVVYDGEGLEVVVATGSASEMGRIALEAGAVRKEQTVLQRSMTGLARSLAVLAIVVSALIPAIGFLQGADLQQMIVTWLALTFLMIPGQPPIIITMALSLAALELARKSVLVKRLYGAEAMGTVDMVLTDKTGTITENRMRLRSIILPDGREVAPADIPGKLKEMIALAVPRHPFDPTDKAVVSGLKLSGEGHVPVYFGGFSRGRPWRELIYRTDQCYEHLVAGSPEVLIQASALPESQKSRLTDALQRHASGGLRVTAFARRLTADGQPGELPGAELLAMAVIEDPVRPGMAGALARLGRAGVTVSIVTGDSPGTASYVAKEIGLGGGLLSGTEVDRMDDRTLMLALAKPGAYARMSPQQKLRLVNVARRQAEVAYVGDGINDAPAIRAASVGVAMGEAGTGLAREIADLVLTDDNFARIADAVKVGRKALDNFQKGLTYYLTAKAILLAAFVVPLAIGVPFPFAPIHIIIIELLMDLASSTIFVAEQAEPDLMAGPPQKVRRIIGPAMARNIVVHGTALAAGLVSIFLWLYFSTGNLMLARTATLVTWLLGHIMLALNMKQRKLPLLKEGIIANRFGALWLGAMIALSLALTGVPALRPYLMTAPLPPSAWAAILGVAIVSTFWLEAAGLARHLRLKKQDTR